VYFTVGSDAHATSGVGEVVERTAYLDDMGFEEKNHWKPGVNK
jgi:hypothetical protein